MTVVRGGAYDRALLDEASLLRRFKPKLRYDAAEAFFADHVAIMTDGPGCTLRQGETTLLGGRGMPALALAALRAGRYDGGSDATDDDRICLGSKNYRTDYFRLCQQRPELRNRVYGRATRDATHDKRLWLQYWLFYAYNDHQLVGRFGMHEGDWELVTLRIDETKEPVQPDLAVYAQHAYADMRDWPQVLKDEDEPDRPLVFVGLGSHASYFEPGLYQTEALFDLAEGDHRIRGELGIEVIEDDPPWLGWPGIWGATRARIEKIESDSPRGPAGRPIWSDPANALHLAQKRPETARRLDASDLDRDPDLDARRLGRRLLVDYVAPPGGEAASLVVNINPPNRASERPRTFTFDVAGRAKGVFVVEYAALDPGVEYDVSMTVSDDAARPLARRDAKIDEARPGRRERSVGELRLVAFFVGDRLRRLLGRLS